MMKWTKCAIRFLRISRPGVRVPSIAPRKTSTRCVLVFLFVCTMEGARTRRRRTAPQAISPVGCCLELRVAAPSIRLVPWVALASCWPLPQQLLLASATGRSRRCCRSQWLGISTVEAVDRKISWLFCFISHGCTVFARSVLSMSDDVGRCIALQSVPFFCVSRNQGVTHTTLLAKSCAKGVRVATGDPHPFGNPRETPINCAAHTRPVR